MPRKGNVPKREIIPDAKYNSKLVTKFVNALQIDGKKSTAERHLYNAIELLGERANDDGLKVFAKAIDNIKPSLEVRSRRVGGSTYQVPMEVRPDRRLSLAIRWLIQFTKSRSERSLGEKLAGEILDAYNNRGNAVKKRDTTHAMAEANRAFAHYRW